jgi:hypothetical protein
MICRFPRDSGIHFETESKMDVFVLPNQKMEIFFHVKDFESRLTDVGDVRKMNGRTWDI